ncbi:hypothetical protein JOF56_010939 [Kibdelosporangium banguiense]|uniref:DUF397 domain-containing protein n=1 Tax=Kibdelosporangium banguiense TaxID=1365924 RepID=A0ABS4U1N1_9PSEU|nr:Scr1 family TA system antitoxin-like transcriptional regulator [Kibdelosporangium banguiense]MBP2330554.1 hypothetical protein [Kibdelosporangium banguiense]
MTEPTWYEEGLLDEVRETHKQPWYTAYVSKGLGYVDVETAAAQVLQFLPLEIPGLLQTEAYIRALFSTTHSRNEQETTSEVRTVDHPALAWRKSTYSSHGTSGDCVELACSPLATAVRDAHRPG